jgi:hypothetical protein
MKPTKVSNDFRKRAEANHCTPVHRIGKPAEGLDKTRVVNRRKGRARFFAVLFAT